jgi:hypothetical protein
VDYDPSNEDNPWKWKSLSNLNIPINDRTKLEGILQDRKINLNNKDDKLRWALSNDGTYKVKEGYKLILNSQRREEISIPMNLCWDPAILPKAGIFLWAALQNSILTADRIKKMGFEGPSRCILCKKAKLPVRILVRMRVRHSGSTFAQIFFGLGSGSFWVRSYNSLKKK